MAKTSLIKHVITEDADLFRAAQNGDVKAQNILVMKHYNLCHLIANKYSNAYPHEEAVSMCAVALIKAVRTFKVDMGYKFTTYATSCMDNEILFEMRKQRKRIQTVSYEEKMKTQQFEHLTIKDVLTEEMAFEDCLTEREHQRVIRMILSELKTELKERDYKAFVLRFGLEGNKPHCEREIAEIIGFSRSYVARILMECSEKAKEILIRHNYSSENLLV